MPLACGYSYSYIDNMLNGFTKFRATNLEGAYYRPTFQVTSEEVFQYSLGSDITARHNLVVVQDNSSIFLFEKVDNNLYSTESKDHKVQ